MSQKRKHDRSVSEKQAVLKDAESLGAVAEFRSRRWDKIGWSRLKKPSWLQAREQKGKKQENKRACKGIGLHHIVEYP